MRHRLTACIALIVAMASVGHAQPHSNPSAVAGFNGLILTPAGALPLVVRAQRTMDTATLGEIAVRYGRYNFQNPVVAFDNIGVTAQAHLLRRIQVGGTFAHRTCSGCQGVTMGSADVALPLYRKAATADIGGDTDIGLLVSAGMGKADSSGVKARSFTASVPVAISLPEQNGLLTLFVSPSLAYGSFTLGTTDGAILGIAGAGASYAFRFGLGVHIELHRILAEDSPTQFGMALSYQFAR